MEVKHDSWFRSSTRTHPRPFAPLLPHYLKIRLPIVGRVKLRRGLPKPVTLLSDGRDPITSRLYWMGVDGYEGPTLRVFLKLLDGCRCFIDAGANVGVFALVAAVENPKRKVHAFEPVPRIRERLERNAAANAASNVRADARALGKESGTATLYVPREPSPLSASLREDFQLGNEPVAVSVTTLDAYAAEQRLPKIDLLKLDTEGTEPDVLIGGDETIYRDRPPILVEVLPKQTEMKMQHWTEKKKYVRYQIMDPLDNAGQILAPRATFTNHATFENPNWLLLPSERVREIEALIEA